MVDVRPGPQLNRVYGHDGCMNFDPTQMAHKLVEPKKLSGVNGPTRHVVYVPFSGCNVGLRLVGCRSV
jgi:hypothetical protein